MLLEFLNPCQNSNQGTTMQKYYLSSLSQCNENIIYVLNS